MDHNFVTTTFEIPGVRVARISPAVPERWFPLRAADDLLVGDPAVRDAALHALQVCVPHRRVLPVAARRALHVLAEPVVQIEQDHEPLGDGLRPGGLDPSRDLSGIRYTL